MRFDIITIFPKIFDSYLDESIIKRAREKKIAEIKVHNLRDFSRGKPRTKTSLARDKRQKVDDRPYGGGAGMVLMAEPILRSVNSIIKRRDKKTKIIILSAKGRQFNQKTAQNWAKNLNRIIFISGRYEGIDERVANALEAEEISIGPYILTDGDVAAMIIISAVTRLLPGAIKFESLKEESFFNSLLKKESKNEKEGLLEYPHFTRPEVFEYKGKKYRVPKVLLSGDHKKIAAWRSSKQKQI